MPIIGTDISERLDLVLAELFEWKIRDAWVGFKRRRLDANVFG
jgi:hypothetical protein